MEDTNKLFRRTIDREDIDLDKVGWTACKNDEEIFSYIRGYIWRNYKVRIKSPLDFIIKIMLDDAMAKNDKLNK